MIVRAHCRSISDMSAFEHELTYHNSTPKGNDWLGKVSVVEKRDKGALTGRFEQCICRTRDSALI